MTKRDWTILVSVAGSLLLLALLLAAFSEGGNPLGGIRRGGEGTTDRVNIASAATSSVVAAGTGLGRMTVCNDSLAGIILYCSYGTNATSGQGVPLYSSSTASQRCESFDREEWVGGFTCYSLGGAATATVGGY